MIRLGLPLALVLIAAGAAVGVAHARSEHMKAAKNRASLECSQEATDAGKKINASGLTEDESSTKYFNVTLSTYADCMARNGFPNH